MNEKTLKTIKQNLLKEKKNLEELLKNLASKNIHNENDYTANFPDFGDEQDENAAEVATFSDNLSLEKKLEKNLQDVAAALKSIEDRTYGKCRYCGNEIEEKRLLARPVSGACIKCKNKFS